MNSITSYQTQYLTSVKQALNMSMLQKSLKQGADAVESNLKAMQSTLEPHKGQNIDISI